MNPKALDFRRRPPATPLSEADKELISRWELSDKVTKCPEGMATNAHTAGIFKQRIEFQ